jgi:hypothetical protein
MEGVLNKYLSKPYFLRLKLNVLIEFNMYIKIKVLLRAVHLILLIF